MQKTINTFKMKSCCLTTLIFYVCLFPISCKKFIEVDPPKNQLITSSVFESDQTANAAAAGIYSEMNNSSGFASGSYYSVTLLAGISADELFDYYGSVPDFFNNDIQPTNGGLKEYLWGEGFKFIFYANSILEGISKSNSLSVSVKNQIEGEAKFVRAFCNFYLINMFGDIPLIKSTDYTQNKDAVRAPSTEVYQQIIADLKEAQNLLPDNYTFAGGERIRPNKWAATALLARVYLYQKNWADAEAEASSVIANTATYSLQSDLNTVFLKNSREAIWQLLSVNDGIPTWEGATFICPGYVNFVTLNNSVYNGFESGDMRKVKWVGTFFDGVDSLRYPFKYKLTYGDPMDEYSTVFRLAEQYLIRAEARARQNNIAGSQTDLNIIRNRAGLGVTTANDETSLLSAIEQERRVELFTEWGHRWFDLKRWNRANAVLVPLKAPNWQATDTLYPIPQTEISNNPNLTQNPGY